MAGRIVLFGGGGFIGGHLALAALKQGWEVVIVDPVERPGVPGAQWRNLDITDRGAVRSLFQELKPAAAVDLAAVADIDRAEKERELAWGVNVEAARTIAACSAEAGSWFLYFSSEAIFDGEKPPYREEDPPNPVNYYGKTKMEGEKAVLAACPRAGIIRISLALGFPVTGGNSYFAGLEANLKAGKDVTQPSDEIRTPVDVYTLTSCIMELAAMEFSGVIHIGSTDSLDRAALSRKAAGLMGYPETRIIAAVSGAPLPGRAPRHKNGIISVGKARALLKTPLLNVEETLRRAIIERR
jgi:dTDP-4-dehydrorhamnose reductase